MIIKKATTKEADLLVHFIKKLADYEQFPYDVTVTSDDLRENLLSASSTAEAIILYEENQPCGFAVYYYTFSTTTGKKGIHLDDLFVEPKYHGQGFGKQVLAYLSKLAQKNNCSRFEWWALKNNIPAINFYERIGASQLEELVVFRLNEKEISDMVNMDFLLC